MQYIYFLTKHLFWISHYVIQPYTSCILTYLCHSHLISSRQKKMMVEVRRSRSERKKVRKKLLKNIHMSCNCDRVEFHTYSITSGKPQLVIFLSHKVLSFSHFCFALAIFYNFFFRPIITDMYKSTCKVLKKLSRVKNNF